MPAQQITDPVFEVIALGASNAGNAASGGGSSGAATGPVATRARVHTSSSAWDGVEISQEQASGGDGHADGGGGDGRGETGGGDGHGDGGGRGNGIGGGIGFGAGGGIRAAERVPDPPRVIEPPPSRARPAKLIYPVRDREVDDEGNLFIARITVDTDGDVVGAHMVKTRPGVTGDQASSAIWTFRYLPALDDAGTPIRSTFDQPFQIR